MWTPKTDDPQVGPLVRWTAEMLNASVETAAKIGCSPEAIVAQAALETGWGKSVVGTHNLFGIRVGVGWTGKTVSVMTREVVNGQNVYAPGLFRDYDSFAESIADHFEFLKNNSRYANVFDSDDSMSDEQYFENLQLDGYATDPNYAHALMNMKSSVIGLETHMDQS